MNKLVKLERMLERSMDKLRRKDTPQELVEMIPEILDDIEDHREPSGGRGRVFPYDRVTISLRVSPEEKGAARSLLEDIGERVRQRLKLKGCEPPPGLDVRVHYHAPAEGDEADARPFAIQYRRATRSKAPAPLPPGMPVVRLKVLKGEAGQDQYELKLRRINIGRMESVGSATGRQRRNHVWFVESEDTVSRQHAHVEHIAGEFLLYDDGSTAGTRVRRGAEEFEVLQRAGRGVKLCNGDLLQLGRECVIEFRIVEPATEVRQP